MSLKGTRPIPLGSRARGVPGCAIKKFERREGDKNGTKTETIGRKKNFLCSKTNRPPGIVSPFLSSEKGVTKINNFLVDSRAFLN